MRVHEYKLVILCLLLLSSYVGNAQEVINLYNPSFEDDPQRSLIVNGWNDCGFFGESAPDVQPGSWYVDIPAQDGKTYLGLVTRDNDTWERVSQRLVVPLKADKCYTISLYLASEDYYISTSKLTSQEVNYNAPTVLKIYGGTSVCDRAQLLAESEPVNHTSWEKYTFKLEPHGDYSYIIFEAFYDVPVLIPTNGNLLIDNIQPIKMIPCDEALIAVVNNDKQEEVQSKNAEEHKIKESETVAQNSTDGNINKQEVASAPSKEFQPKYMQELKHDELEEGQVIKIKNLHFKADSSNITPQSIPVLKEIYHFLKENKDVAIEIGGHTNGRPPEFYCKRLSKARAKAVADYLIDMGIDSSRISYKGYGKSNPIANNDTPEGRKKNQRCEIKIVSIGASGKNG